MRIEIENITMRLSVGWGGGRAAEAEESSYRGVHPFPSCLLLALISVFGKKDDLKVQYVT